MTELEEPVITALLHRMFLPAEQRDPKKADEAAERFKKPIAVLDGALAGRQYLIGDDFTIADLNVASVLSIAPMGSLDLAPTPNAAAWLQRCTARPALARAQARTSRPTRRITSRGRPFLVDLAPVGNQYFARASTLLRSRRSIA